jgi:hypothetical protein
MRRLARSPRTDLARCCPTRSSRARAQVGRPLLAALLTVSLAVPARAQAPTDAATVTADNVPPETSDAAAPEATVPDPTVPVSAQDEALRLFRAAKALYGAGRYEEAARGFEASFKAAESPEAAYNAALAHDRVGARLATMLWFRRYLAVARRDSDPSYPLAVKRVEELRARLGELQLQIDDTDEIREVRVNGEVVALAEFPRLVEPGRVEVRLVGDEPGEVADIPAEVAPGGTWTIHFTGFARAQDEPDPRPTVPIVRPQPGPDPEVLRRSKTLARLTWTGVGLTAASAITMGVFGGLALRSQENWERHLKPEGNIDPLDYDAAAADRDALQRNELVTNVMIGVTAGLAVITLALGLATVRERRKLRDGAGGRVRVTAGGLQVVF